MASNEARFLCMAPATSLAMTYKGSVSHIKYSYYQQQSIVYSTIKTVYNIPPTIEFELGRCHLTDSYMGLYTTNNMNIATAIKIMWLYYINQAHNSKTCAKNMFWFYKANDKKTMVFYGIIHSSLDEKVKNYPQHQHVYPMNFRLYSLCGIIFISSLNKVWHT